MPDLPPFALPMTAQRLPQSFGGDQPVTDAFADLVTEIAKGIVMQDGELAPICNVLGILPAEGNRLVHYAILLAPLMGSASGKDVVAALMPQLLAQLHAFCVVTVTEAWVLEGKPGMNLEEMQADRDKYGPDLGDHPDSIEVVNVMIETRQRSTMRSYPMLRDAEGTLTGLGEDRVKGGDYTYLQGRFANWLQPMPGELH